MEHKNNNDDDDNHNIMKEAPVRAANRILHGTLDPDGHVEDVFFDAQEFGDGLDDNEFDTTTSYHRDSILVSSIVSNRGGSKSTTEQQNVSLLKGVNNNNNNSANNEEDSSYSESIYDDIQDNDNLQIAEQKFAKYLSTLPPPPPPPQELPLRFLRAGKGDPVEGLRRYEATLAWRKQHGMDTILRQPCWQYKLIKQHYPSYCHLRGRNNECCYYEQPPRTNLKALREAGVTLEDLLRFYAMITEFQWQILERDDLARSITVIDVQGMRMGDFVGEVKDFVMAASDFCGQHYPERAGYVFVINVPAWFKLIFNVIKPFIDETTLEKIKILRGAQEIQDVMEERIPAENLPPEYGGTSMPLGQSPEEDMFAALCEHNNELARGKMDYCNGLHGNPPCRFCSWTPARSY